jgi:ankyrin repeat protein
MFREQGITNQNNNHKNNQQGAHPGSLQHRNNIKNYIIYILKKACQESSTELCKDNCQLWMMWLLGEDCLDTEIFNRIEDYDCRTKEDIEEYYESYCEVSHFEYFHRKWIKSLSAKSIDNNDFMGFMKLEIKEDAVTMAVYTGSIKFLQVIKNSGYDLRKVTHYGTTPAHIAADKGHEACLRLLHEAGCNLDKAEDTCLQTPAHIAAMNGHEACLRLLKDAGCDLQQVDDDGATPVHIAAMSGHEACLRLLKEAGCDLGQMIDTGATAALMAAMNGHEACLCLLKEGGCDLGQAEANGITPAFMAAQNGHEACLRLLKDAGCDLGQAITNGITPAMEAVRNGHGGCLRVLKEAGCDLDPY